MTSPPGSIRPMSLQIPEWRASSVLNIIIRFNIKRTYDDDCDSGDDDDDNNNMICMCNNRTSKKQTRTAGVRSIGAERYKDTRQAN